MSRRMQSLPLAGMDLVSAANKSKPAAPDVALSGSLAFAVNFLTLI